MEFLSEYAMFLAKVATIVIALISGKFLFSIKRSISKIKNRLKAMLELYLNLWTISLVVPVNFNGAPPYSQGLFKSMH